MDQVKNKRHTIIGKNLNFLKRIDIFARPVQLTFGGKEKFSSKFGGLLSIVIISLLITLFAYNLRALTNRS